MTLSFGSGVGMFGYLAKPALVKNVRIVSGAVNSVGMNGTGSIVGIMRSGTMLLNCANSASVTSTSWNTGGIVGEMQTGSSAWNCYNTGTVTASRYTIGGIAGVVHDLYNCYNLGDVRCEWDHGTSTLRVGGIAGVSTGYESSDTKNILRNCYNAGKITTLNGNKKDVGLIMGNGNNGSTWSAAPVTLTNCWSLQTDAINAGLSLRAMRRRTARAAAPRMTPSSRRRQPPWAALMRITQAATPSLPGRSRTPTATTATTPSSRAWPLPVWT